jgi:hypothetical protein
VAKFLSDGIDQKNAAGRDQLPASEPHEASKNRKDASVTRLGEKFRRFVRICFLRITQN